MIRSTLAKLLSTSCEHPIAKKAAEAVPYVTVFSSNNGRGFVRLSWHNICTDEVYVLDSPELVGTFLQFRQLRRSYVSGFKERWKRGRLELLNRQTLNHLVTVQNDSLLPSKTTVSLVVVLSAFKSSHSIWIHGSLMGTLQWSDHYRCK